MSAKATNIDPIGTLIAEQFTITAVEALNGALEADFERGYTFPEAKTLFGRNMHPVEASLHGEIAYTLRDLRKNRSQKAITALL